MATSLLRNPSRPDLYICARCALRSSRNSNNAARRWIGTKYLAKVADAQLAWGEQAKAIRSGKKKSMFKILEERGYIHQTAGSRESIEEAMIEHRIGAYVGVDPTAPSIHVGHLLPFMAIFWMYLHGFHAVTLLGGATAKIGDPTDRLTTRETLLPSIRNENMYRMHYQLKAMWLNVERLGRKYGYNWEWAWKRGLLNNYAWMNKLTVMEFLQLLGPGMRMGAMMAKDTVKNKMTKGDGMSYSEFTYPLLQAWDWWHMYDKLGISMQIGGADQYGNITAGIDAVKYIKANHNDPQIRDAIAKTPEPTGFTVPLLTTSSGAKFGKSAGNAIWLDKDLMTSFDLYGYFMRTSDQDVERYLKLFTFKPLEEISRIMQEHVKDPSQRKAQHTLAKELVDLVHGDIQATAAEAEHRLRFAKPGTSEATQYMRALQESKKEPDHINVVNRPKSDVKLPKSFVYTRSISRIIYAAGLAASTSEANRLAGANGIYIGGQPDGFKGKDDVLTYTTVKVWKNEETHKFLQDGRLLILRRGKANIRIVEVIPDEEFEASGEKFPGIEEYDPEAARKLLREKEELAGKPAPLVPGPNNRPMTLRRGIKWIDGHLEWKAFASAQSHVLLEYFGREIYGVNTDFSSSEW
ncbi:tyrosyl-tRNA synthetase protein [Rutstroemia sp. NJR-2017a BBW]|nr:tyrosyl-tRNA synthetase protein [Rutstroemia sp. NJR-2017a BBW]